jgi:SET domain-containing protein
LLVPVRVDRSPIHGLGVFALDRIAEGTVVWTFTPGFDLDLDPRALDDQLEHFRRTMLHYGYIDPVLDRFILCCDDYRFINHSDSPNIRVDKRVNRYGVDVAARDIDAGEELMVDYEYVEGCRPAQD